MKNDDDFKENLELIGKHYRSACVFRFSGYMFASKLAGKELPVYTQASGEIDEINRLTDLQLGAMLAAEWGAPVPPKMMVDAGLTMPTPGTFPIH